MAFPLLVHPRSVQMPAKIDAVGLSTLSLNCSVTLARAAFEAACKCYPARRLILKWGGYVLERHEPKREAS